MQLMQDTLIDNCPHIKHFNNCIPVYIWLYAMWLHDTIYNILSPFQNLMDYILFAICFLKRYMSWMWILLTFPVFRHHIYSVNRRSISVSHTHSCQRELASASAGSIYWQILRTRDENEIEIRELGSLWDYFTL